MKNATKILATVALGAVLAAGSATASMARGGGGHGGAPFAMNHGGGFGGVHSFGGHPFIMSHGGDRGFGSGRSFGGHPFVMSHGGDRGFGMRHGLNGDRGFAVRHAFNGDHRLDGRRHFGGFRDDGEDFDGVFGFGPFWGPGQYWAYNGNAAGYCDPTTGTYLELDGLRYYCR